MEVFPRSESPYGLKLHQFCVFLMYNAAPTLLKEQCLFIPPQGLSKSLLLQLNNSFFRYLASPVSFQLYSVVTWNFSGLIHRSFFKFLISLFQVAFRPQQNSFSKIPTGVWFFSTPTLT